MSFCCQRSKPKKALSKEAPLTGSKLEDAVCNAGAGNEANGVYQYDDPACAKGGLGCVPPGNCRYCKTSTASASLPWVACPSGVGPNQEPTTAPAGPTPAPAGPTPAPAQCSTDYKGYPDCQGRMDWMKKNWDQYTYTSQGVDGSACSIQRYLHEENNWCPPCSCSAPTGNRCTLPTGVLSTTSTCNSGAGCDVTQLAASTLTCAEGYAFSGNPPTGAGAACDSDGGRFTGDGVSRCVAKVPPAPQECDTDYAADPKWATCESRMQWMASTSWWSSKPNWDQTKYTSKGVDGSRCSIQKYLHDEEGYCPRCSCGSPSPTPVPPAPTPTQAPAVYGKPQLRPYAYFISKAAYNKKSGRDLDGNLFLEAAGAVPVEAGFKTAADLALYPFRFAHGHPFYAAAPGQLQGSTWSEHVRKVAEAVPQQTLQALQADSSQVLEVSGSGLFFIDTAKISGGQLRCRGLVVRHGGTLLFDDAADLTLSVEFVLVESGGVLQAGSHFDDRFRYTHALNIKLTNPDAGFTAMACVASQYSYIAYNPGVRLTDDPSRQFQDFTGSQAMFNNMFGKKVVANGFNGNIHLASALPARAQYLGTWGASSSSEAKHDVIGERDMLTYFSGADAAQKAAAKQCNIETAYPVCWSRLRDGRYGPGTDHTDHVLLEPRDTRAESGAPLSAKDLQWPVGARVVISARSPGGYLTADDPTGTGMLPLWLDWTSKADRDANQRANDTILKGLKAGVEVATIKAVDTDGDAIKVSFARPLKLLHDSSRHKMTRTLVDGSQSSCYVDTQLHVALLSRKISISSDFSSAPGDGGCNVRPWDKPPTGQCCGCPGEQTIVPNYEAGAGNNVYAACYKTLYEQTKTGPPKVDDELLNYWGDGAAPPRPKGHWLYGTTGLQGPNSILGGHTMFRYGSGAVLDGVELWRLGQPGNFGSIGRYPLHCHLSGAAQSFSAYLPEGAAGKFGRGMEILNGSCWLSFNRWYTVHGSQEVNIKNNTGFVSQGSGFFLEDGTEIHNTMEHNMAVACLTAPPNPYWNPAPILPNVSSDFGQPSAYWMKNNMNALFRNVACNSPNPVIGVWAVPQKIAYLRGPSSVCVGDAALQLPGIAAAGNCVGMGATSWGRSPGGLGVNEAGGQPPAWAPAEFADRLLTGTDGVLLYSNSNMAVPFFRWAENVVYNMAAAMGSFPEFLGDGLPNYRGLNEVPGTVSAGAAAMAFYMPDENGKRPKTVTQWLPGNGQNLATDKHGQATYLCSQWAAGNPDKFPYTPIAKTEYDAIDAKGHTLGYAVGADVIPTVLSGWLSWNIGANAQFLWGGAGWGKSTATWIVNSCFLGLLGGTCVPNSLPRGSSVKSFREQVVPFNARTASVFANTVGDNVFTYSSIYHVYYNLLTDGGLCLPGNPTVVGGKSTFIADTARPALVEYSFQDGTAGMKNVANCRWYFMDTPFQKLFPMSFWTGDKVANGGFMSKGYLTAIELVNMDDKEAYLQYLSDQPSKRDAPPRLADTRKYPYLFGEDGQLLRTDQAADSEFADAHPEWMGYVANVTTGQFVTGQAQDIGNKIGVALKKVPHDTKGPQGDTWVQPKDGPFKPAIAGVNLPFDSRRPPFKTPTN